jgi:hypothetical protein
MNDDTIELFCHVEGDSAVFPVIISVEKHISSLKELVHQKGKTTREYCAVLCERFDPWEGEQTILEVNFNAAASSY